MTPCSDVVRCLLLPSSGQAAGSSEVVRLCCRIHGVTFQKTTVFISTAVRIQCFRRMRIAVFKKSHDTNAGQMGKDRKHVKTEFLLWVKANLRFEYSRFAGTLKFCWLFSSAPWNADVQGQGRHPSLFQGWNSCMCIQTTTPARSVVLSRL